jgi:hypothetical protein
MNVRRIALLVSLLLAPLSFAAEQPAKTLTPGDNLVIDGIPPIPMELVEQIGRYTESRSGVFQDWHPAKAEMLITTRFGDTNQVHRVAMPGGARTQLTFFPDRIDGASFEPTKGDYFIFTKGVGGNEFNQNYRYDFATGDGTLLTTASREIPDRPGATRAIALHTRRRDATAPTPTFMWNRRSIRRPIACSRK